ncbi:receptor-type tyrosine-protein phosphatase H [Pseudorca crassidens]|uniref:receptor-type tyrosine-protein phosphatase H n=1 Tax=Pseudorca crassidens TaxID=82174 RepID=UPI00352E8B7F
MGLLGHFYVLAIPSNALNIRVQVSMWTYVFISLGCIPRSGIVRSYGAIVGAIVSPLLFLILVGLLVFFLKRRHKKSEKKPAPGDLVFSFPGDVLAEDFADHVRKHEDSGCGFAEEYQVGRPWRTTASPRRWPQLRRTAPRTVTETCCPVKCEHYWPLDAQPCTHVTLVGEEVMENWTVRNLKLWHASHCRGLFRCRAQASAAQAQRPWLTGPAAPRHVGSSRTGARTHVPCIGRRTLNHCVTREALKFFFK